MSYALERLARRIHNAGQPAAAVCIMEAAAHLQHGRHHDYADEALFEAWELLDAPGGNLHAQSDLQDTAEESRAYWYARYALDDVTQAIEDAGESATETGAALTILQMAAYEAADGLNANYADPDGLHAHAYAARALLNTLQRALTDVDIPYNPELFDRADDAIQQLLYR